jgi:hypothetical protein
VVSVSAYVRADATEDEAVGDACGAVVLEDAVARASTVAVSFVDWEYADIGRLQRSR